MRTRKVVLIAAAAVIVCGGTAHPPRSCKSAGGSFFLRTGWPNQKEVKAPAPTLSSP